MIHYLKKIFNWTRTHDPQIHNQQTMTLRPLALSTRERPKFWGSVLNYLPVANLRDSTESRCNNSKYLNLLKTDKKTANDTNFNYNSCRFLTMAIMIML